MNLYKFKYFFSALLIMALTFTSCDEVEDAEPGGTSVEAMSGDWWIVGLFPDGTVAYGGDYEQWSTYNTAADNGGMWLDDFGHFFELKSKVTANVSNLTFSGETDAEEVITGGTVTVTNGIIRENAFTTASNTVVNTIEFEAEFSWDPGTAYKFVGHKRTGFAEDENPHYDGSQ